MQLIHFGKDYRDQLAGIPERELQTLQICEPKFLLPSNPVVSKSGTPIRIAFFGYNSGLCDCDFEQAQRQKNVTEWCRDDYNPKLLTVMDIWLTGLPQQYTADGAGYYSNVVKLVLRERLYKQAVQVQRTLRNLPESTKMFKMLLKHEAEQLIEQGCRVFVCFGRAAYDFALPVVESMNAVCIQERHFSWYREAHTRSAISRCSSNSVLKSSSVS